MSVRMLANRLSLIALTVALVFSPSIANADDPPQSGSNESQTGSREDGHTHLEGGEGDLGRSSVEPRGASKDSDAGDPSSEGEESEAPTFEATYLDLIIQAVEEDPSMGIDEISEAVGLPPEGPLSLIHKGGKLSVSVTFAEPPTPSDVDAVGHHAEVRRVLDVAPVIMGFANPTALAGLREVPGVTEVEVNLAPDTAVEDKELTEQEEALLRGALKEAAQQEGDAATSFFKKSCRSIPAAANAPLKVTEAHRDWGVDGTGVTVGILSTTYDEDPYAFTTAQEDVKNGLLPGKGNPCGYTQPDRKSVV